MAFATRLFYPPAGGGGNTTASYLTATAEADLSNETNLGALTSGLVKIAVAAGVATVSTATDGTDYFSSATDPIVKLHSSAQGRTSPFDISLSPTGDNVKAYLIHLNWKDGGTGGVQLTGRINGSTANTNCVPGTFPYSGTVTGGNRNDWLFDDTGVINGAFIHGWQMIFPDRTYGKIGMVAIWFTSQAAAGTNFHTMCVAGVYTGGSEVTSVGWSDARSSSPNVVADVWAIR